MKRQLTVALLAAGIAAAVWAVPAPAAAVTSGSESFHGMIIKGRTGAVITSVVVAKGVFHGAGRIVETASRPGDPANTVRDDLVFAAGRMHLISTILAAPSTLNPHSCLLRLTVQQTNEVVGGTGQFTAATGSFTVVLISFLRRASSCRLPGRILVAQQCSPGSRRRCALAVSIRASPSPDNSH